MKTFKISIFLLAASIAVNTFAESHYVVRVDGLACPFCAYGIEKTFRKIEGVRDVKVDLDAGKVYLRTADEVQFTEEQLKDIFADTGFTYRGLERHQREIPQE